MMAKISLRAYNQEIDNLIERGLIEEAIAHCRHILSIFPKHVDTYRMLGKAFLEGQRYGDAADILQRVLSSIPDDFVSHVGMSITREDEGNLDEAISHMERAFEIQPSNNAIQDELRRLYGRRDGFEPPKIRLTRGALARMYFKGELYQQAIAELRAGLVEDSSRLDLQTLLAQAYARSGQRAEAADACVALLKKLPYSLAANQIMSEILTVSDRDEDIEAYNLRLQELDPYFAHLSPSASTPALVSDQAVTLERLDYRPGMDSQPNWAASLGASISSEPAEELPDWLASDEVSPQSQIWESSADMSAMEDPGQTERVEEGEAEDNDQEIPEWLREAGWGPSTGVFVEGPMVMDENEDILDEESLNAVPSSDQESDDLAQADIPSWLKEVAPEEQAEEQAEETEDFSWIEDSKTNAAEIEPGSLWESGDEEETSPQSETEPEAVRLSDEELPDWLKDLREDTPAEQAFQPASEWQREPTEEAAEAEEEPVEVEEPELEALATSIPTWMQELDAEKSTSSEQVGTYDRAGEEAGGIPTSDMEEDFQAARLAGTTAIAAMSVQEPDNEPSEGDIDIPDWLRAEPEAESQPASVDEPEIERTSGPATVDHEQAPVEPPAGVPDWVQETRSEAEPAFSDRDNWIEQSAEEGLPSENFEDEAAPEPEATGEEDLWADSLRSQAAQIFDSQEPEQADIPDWLSEMESEAVASEPVDPLAETKPSRVRNNEQASAAVELESTADLPDWMLADAESEDVQAPEEEIEPGELPDWLLEAKAETDQTVVEASEELDEAEKAELPDWIKDLQGAPSEVEPEAWTEAEGFELAEQPAEMMDQAAAVEQGEEVEIPEGEAVLETIAEEEEETSPQEQSTPEEIDLDAAFAWMEGLAARQGVEEALLLNPEDRLETPPEWIQAAAAEAGIEEPIKGQASGAVWIVDTPEGVEIQPVDLASALTANEQAAAAERSAGEEQLQASEDEATSELTARSEEGVVPGQALVYSTPVRETEATSEEQAQDVEEGPGVELSGEDSDAAFAWLESLAARQGAEEALLLTPEERRETPPDWVQAAAASAEEQPAILEPADGEPVHAGTVEDLEQESELEHSDWLVEMESEARQIEVQEAYARTESAAQDLIEEDVEIEAGQDESQVLAEPEAVSDEEAPQAEPVEGGRMPDWLREMVEPEETPEAPPVAEAPPLPEGLKSEFEMDEQAAAADLAVEVGQAAEQEAPEPFTEQPALSAEAEAVPALPDWLAEGDTETSEPLEWTPPVADQLARRYDLNQASLGELERLPGVGFIMAQSIIRYREANGPFEKVEDLLLVPGLSPTTLEFIQDQVFVSAPARIEPVQPVPPAEVQTSETPAIASAGEDAPVLQRGEAPEEFEPARQALDSGDTQAAADRYTSLIKGKQNLPLIIEDLQQAVQRWPQEVLLWQALGDALMRADQVKEAIEAYDRAEELLR